MAENKFNLFTQTVSLLYASYLLIQEILKYNQPKTPKKIKKQRPYSKSENVEPDEKEALKNSQTQRKSHVAQRDEMDSPKLKMQKNNLEMDFVFQKENTHSHKQIYKIVITGGPYIFNSDVQDEPPPFPPARTFSKTAGTRSSCSPTASKTSSTAKGAFWNSKTKNNC